MIKFLIVTSCTGDKKSNPEGKLLLEDFIEPEVLHRREEELKEYAIPAADMYTGMQHQRLMEGIKNLRNHFGSNVVDLAIVSAGYGLLNENDKIVPYEVTFNSMNTGKVLEWSNNLKINEDLSKLVEGYDLVIFLLGDKYLRALNLPLKNIDEDKKLIFLASPTSEKLIPHRKQYHFVEVCQDDARSFGYGLVGLKGYLFKLLSNEIVGNGHETLDMIYNDPNNIMRLLDKYRKDEAAVTQMSLFPEPNKPLSYKKKKDSKSKEKSDEKAKNIFSLKSIIIPSDQYAANYGNHEMRYFIPECDDRVDPNFDFLNETIEKGVDAYSRDVYAHEIYDTPNYDGILVSKVYVDAKKTKIDQIKKVGIHNYIRFPRQNPVMGDCGAFSYINDFEPPYTTEEILDYYEELGFDIGVSIDHAIVGDIINNVEERLRRYEITRKNAADFIKMHKEKCLNFTPSGIAQGWDPKSYRDSVAELIAMGYNHISIGGLALSPSSEIVDVLKEVSKVIKEDIEIHLFGVQRLDGIDIFRKLGITSFDSSSYLIQAFKAGKYYSNDGEAYTSIRIPQSHGGKVKKLIKEGMGTEELFKQKEQKTLDALRGYDKGNVGLDDALEVILDYTELMGIRRKKYEDKYRKILEDMPWKKCECKICKEAGVETIIFRGNNRNRRRGFHNTYVFYKLFKEGLNK